MANVSPLSLFTRSCAGPADATRYYGDVLREASQIIHLVQSRPLIQAETGGGWIAQTLDRWTWLPDFLTGR